MSKKNHRPHIVSGTGKPDSPNYATIFNLRHGMSGLTLLNRIRKLANKEAALRAKAESRDKKLIKRLGLPSD